MNRPAHYDSIRARFPEYVLFFSYPHDAQYVAFDHDARTVAGTLLTREPNPNLDVFTFDRDEAKTANDAINAADGVVKIISIY